MLEDCQYGMITSRIGISVGISPTKGVISVLIRQLIPTVQIQSAIWQQGPRPWSPLWGLLKNHLFGHLNSDWTVNLPNREGIYAYISNRQDYCNTNLGLLRLGLAEGCAKASLPIGATLYRYLCFAWSPQSLKTQKSSLPIGDDPNLCRAWKWTPRKSSFFHPNSWDEVPIAFTLESHSPKRWEKSWKVTLFVGFDQFHPISIFGMLLTQSSKPRFQMSDRTSAFLPIGGTIHVLCLGQHWQRATTLLRCRLVPGWWLSPTKILGCEVSKKLILFLMLCRWSETPKIFPKMKLLAGFGCPLYAI